MFARNSPSIFSDASVDTRTCKRAPLHDALTSWTTPACRLRLRASWCARARAADRAPERMERRSQEYRLERTIHRRRGTVGETPSLLPKAHRTVVGSAAPAPYLRAAIRMRKCDARGVPRHSMTLSQQLPFRARYHRENRCHAQQVLISALIACRAVALRS